MMVKKSYFIKSEKYKKPQINADERRCFPVTGLKDIFIDRCFYIMDFSKIIHRKGRKERKAMQQESLRPLRSLRLNVFFTPAHEQRGSLHGMPELLVQSHRAGNEYGR